MHNRGTNGSLHDSASCMIGRYGLAAMDCYNNSVVVFVYAGAAGFGERGGYVDNKEFPI